MTPVLRGESPSVEHVAGIPFPDADLFSFAALLPPAERARLARLHDYLQAEIRPAVVGPWNREEFPDHLLPGPAFALSAAAGPPGRVAVRSSDRKSTRLNSSHVKRSRMPSSA